MYEPGYLTWVHDYHLLLLPSYILRRHRTAHIGLFLHSPFPASDVFRTIAVRDELLRAMLNADLIGFLLLRVHAQLPDVLQADARPRVPIPPRRLPRSRVWWPTCHGASLDVWHLAASAQAAHGRRGDGAGARRSRARRRVQGEPRQGDGQAAGHPRGRRLPRPFQGVQLKLLAWEGLLINYPGHRRGHALVQICLARNQVKLVQGAIKVQEEIETIVRRISASFPGTIFYELRSGISTAARMLLWQESDVSVFSAVKAVNVWPLEYVLARSFANVPAGVLVLSEFTGFARVLNGALQVNPFSQNALQGALDMALQLPAAEREARAKKDLGHIVTNTSEDWGRRFLVDLKSMKRKQEEHWMAVGFGLASFRMVGMGNNFKALDTQQCLLSFRRSARRAFLLDWGGTLTPADSGFYDVRDSQTFEVAEGVLDMLRALCADPNNHVMILSGLGRDKRTAGVWLRAQPVARRRVRFPLPHPQRAVGAADARRQHQLA